MIEISLKLRIGRRGSRPTADPAPPYVEDGPTAQAEVADGDRWPELHGDAHGWSEPDDPDDRRPRKVGFCR